MRDKKHLPDAQQRLGVANHLLTRTYPLVNDSRMLLAVAKELHQANMSAMSAFLENEFAMKRIPALPQFTESRMELLEEAIQHHSLNKDYLKNIKELHNITVTHEKSPIEFAKPDKFVICDNEYKLTTVTVDQLKASLSISRQFIDKVSQLLSGENGRVSLQREG